MSRFVTSQVASRVFRELTLDSTQRESGGDTFTLAIQVRYPDNDEGTLYTVRLNADRLPLEVIRGSKKPEFVRPGGEVIINTKARLAPDEESFDIDIQLPPASEQKSSQAEISVSHDIFTEAIRDYLERTDRGEH